MSRFICPVCGVEMRPKKNGITCHYGARIMFGADLWACKSCGNSVAYTSPEYHKSEKEMEVLDLDIVMKMGRSDEQDMDPVVMRRRDKIQRVHSMIDAEGTNAILLGNTHTDQEDYADAIVGLTPSPTGLHVTYIRGKVIEALMVTQEISHDEAETFYVQHIIHAPDPGNDANVPLFIEDVK